MPIKFVIHEEDQYIEIKYIGDLDMQEIMDAWKMLYLQCLKILTG